MNFNFLKITTFALASLAIINLSSCNKTGNLNEFDNLLKSQEADLTFEESSYEMVYGNLSNTIGFECYIEGTITYTKEGEELAKVDFGGDTSNEEFAVKKDGVTKKYKLKKNDKYDYEKVIIQPIVKTVDCKYPTSGMVDFFKDGVWVASIDFGDGTCDDLATKTYDGGSKTFNLKYLYK